VPIIKFSVVWWQTLHQPTSLWRSDGPAMEAAMLQPLIVMALSFLALFTLLYLLALRANLLHQQILLTHSISQRAHTKELILAPPPLLP